MTRKIVPATEAQIQRAFATLYAQAAGPHMIGHSIPNEHIGGKGHIGKLKGMGLLPGCADWIVWWPGHVAYIEFKAESGKQSAAQAAFEEAVRAAGGGYCLARSPSYALMWLEAVGAPLRRVWRDGALVMREDG
tara:strand:- start:1347 stop:1748 length:402 start_codon:yes stop_codon:yes gene_type:complete